MFESFGSASKYYDVFHRGKDYAAEAAMLRQRFPLAKTVLEIGAGTGLLTRELLKLDLAVTSLEPSEEMAKVFKKNNPGVRLHEYPVQDLAKIRHTFDLAVAHYDVLNYVPFGEIDSVMEIIRAISWQQSIETWDPSQGVRLFDSRKAEGLRRTRLAFRFGRRVKLFFIYTGKGLCVAKHDLYLHERLNTHG